MNWKRIAAEAGVLIAGALVLGATTNAFLPESRKLAWIMAYQTTAPGLAESSAAHGVTQGSVPAVGSSAPADLLALAPAKDPSLLFLPIPADVARRLYDAGAPFMDARRSSDYRKGHIEGAINIPVWENDAGSRISALHGKGMNPDQVMVVYCSGGSCDDGPRLAEELAFAGFLNIYLYKAGYPDWEQRGWPVEAEKRP